MVDDQIDSSQRCAEIRWLDVDQSQPGAVLVEIVVGNPIDLNIQQANHGEVLRPRDAAKSNDRGRGPISSEQFAQRQCAADGVRGRGVLQQDVNLFAVFEKRANALDFLYVQSVEELRGAKLLEDVGQ